MSRMELEGYAEMVCAFEDSLVVTDSDLLLNWFRVALKRGVITAEQLWVFGVAKVGQPQPLPLDNDGRFTMTAHANMPLFMEEYRRVLRELL